MVAFLPFFASKLPMSAVAGSLEEDPLALAMAPPPDETLEQRLAREADEERNKRRRCEPLSHIYGMSDRSCSDEIDEQIRKERDTERRKKPVRLLLLGASSTG